MINQLFETLNSENIRYCHFKSNAFLRDSFAGSTDFDILVNRGDYSAFVEILSRFGAKQRFSTFNAAYAGTDNYLVYDGNKQKMYHFHVHFELLYGAPLSKNYVIANTNALIEQRVLDKNYPIYILPPPLERALLIQRMLMKFSILNLSFLYNFLIKKTIFKSGLIEEFWFLQNSMSNQQHSHNIAEFKATSAIEEALISDIKSNTVSIVSLYNLKRRLYSHLRDFRRLPTALNIHRKLTRKLAKKKQSRWPVTGGITVSLIGADGSGKSTLAKELKIWINYKFNCKHIYLGLPKTNAIRFSFKVISALRTFGFSSVAESLRAHLQVHIANIRYQRYLEGKQYASAGYIVLFERFPLKDFNDMEEPMDGPRIPISHPLSKKEQMIYENFPHGADLNLVLKVDESVAVNRKKEHQSQDIQKALLDKVEAIEALSSKQYDNFRTIDATLPIDQVNQKAKQAIWEQI